eukprot:scaffold11076_cov122-Cylindrotheca_fusiformis.AAC.10
MADDAEAAEAARIQAEARRKKILEKAQNRMGKVSGEVGVDEEVKKQSASNAARIRAARQRRAKKKAASVESDSSRLVESTGNEKLEVQESEGNDDPAEPIGKTATAVAEAEEATEATKPLVVDGSSAAGESSQISDSSQSEEPKKKYLGVAKMRRKLIMKKKAEEGKSEDTSTSNEFKSSVTKKPVSPIVRIPVYMHVVTVLLLFLAGVDVGLQQYHEDVKIHEQVIFKEFGIPLIHGGPLKNEDSISGAESLDSEVVPSTVELEDEFQSDQMDDEGAGGNIDPLFGVDLDELTRGPGILYQLARGAVIVHRGILQLVYFAPIAIFNSLLALPWALMQTPPALCLVALVLRQIVGKRILKAGIPRPEAEEKDSGIDVIALVKQGVTKYISSSFPTAVGLYDTFSHLRTDMYIIMCGVFVGLAWTHVAQDLQPLGYDKIEEEL